MIHSLALILTGLSLVACAYNWLIASRRIDVSIYLMGRAPQPSLLRAYHSSKRSTIFCAIVFVLVAMP